jgi:hypothetical protein
VLIQLALKHSEYVFGVMEADVALFVSSGAACVPTTALYDYQDKYVEGVPQPDADTGVVLRENFRHILVGDVLSPMQLRKYPLSEGLLERLEIYLFEAAMNRENLNRRKRRKS